MLIRDNDFQWTLDRLFFNLCLKIELFATERGFFDGGWMDEIEMDVENM